MVGIPGAAAYAASKGAVRNHTRTVALYCAEQGWKIRCNSIHPAAILTPMWDPVLGGGEGRAARMEEFVKDTPLRRFGESAEVAALAVLLGFGRGHLYDGCGTCARRWIARRLGHTAETIGFRLRL